MLSETRAHSGAHVGGWVQRQRYAARLQLLHQFLDLNDGEPMDDVL
jgi:hypothetical protein